MIVYIWRQFPSSLFLFFSSCLLPIAQYTLSSAINQIQKARKSFNYHNGKYADDEEIAKFTGLSVAKVKSASKCLRVVGSIEQKVGDCMSAKYMVLETFLHCLFLNHQKYGDRQVILLFLFLCHGYNTLDLSLEKFLLRPQFSELNQT